MAEIYRDSTDKGVSLGLTDALVSEVSFKRNGETVLTTTNPSTTVAIPYKITHLDGKFDVEWKYTLQGDEYTKVDTHEVVTPYFTAPSLIAWDSDFSMLSTEQIFRLETIIRNLIESITGQNFGYEYTTVVVRGSGGKVTPLPKRLVKSVRLNDRTGDLLDRSVRRANDGWAMKTADGEITWVDSLASTNPIQNPFRSYGYFREDVEYALTGYFGYSSVPDDIILAAKILAEDYGCDESLWRDRYIDNIRAADWRFEFDGKAFNGTGNVKVDRILQTYTLNRMVVI